MADPLVIASPPVLSQAPPQCALATTFAQALFSHPDGEPQSDGEGARRLVSLAQRVEARALHLCEGPSAAFFEALVAELGQPERQAELPVLAIDATLGALRLGRPRAALAATGSTDRAEATEAVAVATAALSLAVDVGARFVVLRLGLVAGLGRLWDRLRTHFLRGALLDDEEPAEELMAARAALAGDHLDASLRSLSRLLSTAQRLGVTVLLPTPRRAIELPTAIELQAVRSEFAGAPLAPMLDVPAAHLASMMHLSPLRESVLAFGDGPLVNLSDGCGAVGGLPPGHGEVDLVAIARTLASTTHREFVPWPGLRLGELAAGYRGVAALPLAGPPAGPSLGSSTVR